MMHLRRVVAQQVLSTSSKLHIKVENAIDLEFASLAWNRVQVSLKPK